MRNLTDDVKQGSAWFTEAQFEQMRRDERTLKEWEWASGYCNRPIITREERLKDVALINTAQVDRFKSGFCFTKEEKTAVAEKKKQLGCASRLEFKYESQRWAKTKPEARKVFKSWFKNRHSN